MLRKLVYHLTIENILKNTPDLINELLEWGDCPNNETRVNLKDSRWRAEERCANGYTLQIRDDYCYARIVDSHGFRKAWGSPLIMIEKFKRLTRPSFLEPGDVVGVSRNSAKGVYCHYGVYMGDDRIIHFARNEHRVKKRKDETSLVSTLLNDVSGKNFSIHESSFKDFMRKEKSYFVLFFPEDGSQPKRIMSMNTPSSRQFFVLQLPTFNHFEEYKLYSAEETIERAKSLVGNEGYKLLTNNCEHFAVWCKTGYDESIQIQKFETMGSISIALLIKLLLASIM